jgi:simple sugar transport system substrate-binding protein
MSRNKIMSITTIMIIFVMIVSACQTAAPTTQATTSLTIGMILVGPYNDSGWSQATYEGGQYVVSNLPGSKLNHWSAKALQ